MRDSLRKMETEIAALKERLQQSEAAKLRLVNMSASVLTNLPEFPSPSPLVSYIEFLRSELGKYKTPREGAAALR